MDRIEIEKKKEAKPETAGAVNANFNTAASQTQYYKYHAKNGFGYAAEQANHLYDLLTGNDASIVGGNNAKNGPDRIVNGYEIQSKYGYSAQKSVEYAFDKKTHLYRYGLQQLEVPKGQGPEAREIMRKKISEGKVPGVTDPTDADFLIREGHFTHSQVKNIAKFGTVESIKYDAAKGLITSTSAFGISATITFAISLWNGDTTDIAVEKALYSGIQVGGAAFISYIIAGQLVRMPSVHSFIATSERIIGLLGKESASKLTNTLKTLSNVTGNEAMNHAGKLVANNLISGTVMVVVLSAKDIRNAFEGRISGKQLFKNMAIRAGSMAGASIGAYTLTAITAVTGGAAAIAIAIAGSIAGGAIGSVTTSSVIGYFIEDDAVEMVGIIEEELQIILPEYVVSNEELDIILLDLQKNLEGETLLDMFASQDRKSFAHDLLINIVERLFRFRCRIISPLQDELISGLRSLADGFSKGRSIFSDKDSETKIDYVKVGEEITGKQYSVLEAKKSLYATKQMNLAQVQAEMLMSRMKDDDNKTKSELEDIYKQRKALKQEMGI